MVLRGYGCTVAFCQARGPDVRGPRLSRGGEFLWQPLFWPRLFPPPSYSPSSSGGPSVPSTASSPFGWSDRLAALAAELPPHLLIGRVARVDRGWCTVFRDLDLTQRARTREPLAAGDWVGVDRPRDRRTVLHRTWRSPSSRAAQRGQVLSSNIVTSPSSASPRGLNTVVAAQKPSSLGRRRRAWSCSPRSICVGGRTTSAIAVPNAYRWCRHPAVSGPPALAAKLTRYTADHRTSSCSSRHASASTLSTPAGEAGKHRLCAGDRIAVIRRVVGQLMCWRRGSFSTHPDCAPRAGLRRGDGAVSPHRLARPGSASYCDHRRARVRVLPRSKWRSHHRTSRLWRRSS